MTIADDDPRQPYEQAAETLRQEIKRGVIKPGRMDSVRTLADRFGISPTTVQRSLSVLREEGLITTTARGNFAKSPDQVAASRPTTSPGELSEVLRQLEHVTSQLSDLRDRVERLEAARSGRAVEN
ncbi:GntR family transcriptional regulator [Streptomyces sp. PA03-2a]|uniref:GntR family transcriptional regulator n=1 Tax=Streptomyces sp. PA03-2a TaxID=3028701 RepID=UPI0029B2074A|nr:GntR family transcriptional regulator [Streptomyces sp. PA03-2a]MDX2727696.1 GntR family transcriptional regulator [Streptomyces sp. PA03-2a]